VSLEFAKFFQCRFLVKDEKMTSHFYGEIPTVCQNSTIIEELGQIDYIFSDKTGTLTCNLMEFRNIFIAGTNYGSIEDLLGDSELPQVDNVKFYDSRLSEDLYNPKRPNHKKVKDAVTHLAVCHTALYEGEGADIKYFCSSPDETALINFALFAGYRYESIDDKGTLIVDVKGEKLQYKLLHVLEFNSKRKRMSVILENSDGEIELFIKGADTMIIKR
jgi:phospholipid-transporting ATPase